MKLILPIFAMICTVLATLTAIVFCLAGGANAKPPEIRILKLLMLGFSLLGVAGVTAGIFLLRSGHPGWAAIAATAPTVVIIIVFILSLIFEW